MDNRVFNVNGSGKEMLRAALKLAMVQNQGCYGFKDEFKVTDKAEGWIFSPTKGLILLSYIPSSCKNANKFLTPMGLDSLTETVWEWLKSEEAQSIELDGWFADMDHDGSNGPGWRVYCEDWGQVEGLWGTIAAITPAYMWYGK